MDQRFEGGVIDAGPFQMESFQGRQGGKLRCDSAGDVPARQRELDDTPGDGIQGTDAGLAGGCVGQRKIDQECVLLSPATKCQDPCPALPAHALDEREFARALSCALQLLFLGDGEQGARVDPAQDRQESVLADAGALRGHGVFGVDGQRDAPEELAVGRRSGNDDLPQIFDEVEAQPALLLVRPMAAVAALLEHEGDLFGVFVRSRGRGPFCDCSACGHQGGRGQKSERGGEPGARGFAQASTCRIGSAPSTPTSFCSSPLKKNVRPLGSRPSRCRIVAWSLFT